MSRVASPFETRPALRALCEAMNIGVSSSARLFGVHVRDLRRWLNDDSSSVKPPSLTLMQRFSEAAAEKTGFALEFQITLDGLTYQVIRLGSDTLPVPPSTKSW